MRGNTAMGYPRNAALGNQLKSLIEDLFLVMLPTY